MKCIIFILLLPILVYGQDVIPPADITDLDTAGGSQAIIVDHSDVAVFEQIPMSIIQDVQSNAKIYYMRTSHGYQLVKGMYLILTLNSSYYFPSFAQYTDDLGENSDTTWVPNVRSYLNSHPDRNIAILSWCTGVSINTDAGIYLYLSKMEELEADYPNVTFVYMTGHLDGGGLNGDLFRRNNIIRDYCLANNKVLYDFADIESWNPDGNFYPDDNDACNWCYDWCAVNDCVIPIPCGNDCYHTHCFNCYLKGKGFWCLMSKLYGWSN